MLLEERHRQLQDIIAYASQLKCRHKFLVEYFGEPFSLERCSGCDVCRGEVETVPEARRLARIILSTVLKVRMGFGGAYISQVLTGSRDQKVLHNGHDRISVHGMLAEHPKGQVHDWVNQLESQGYLARSMGSYPTLSVTQSGYWLLRPDKYGKEEADLPVYLLETRRRAAGAVRSPYEGDQPFDGDLFQELRELRGKLATRLGVPAFVVFGDKSLRDMARLKPTTDEAFMAVFGVGSHKLKQFGGPMMKVIRNYEQPNEEAQ